MKSCKMNKSGRLIKKRFMAGECALDAIKEFLEEQAKQGFKLIRVEGSNYWFEEIEPCEIKYSVEIFNKASNYDTIPAKTTEEFIEFCTEAGWDYICSRGKMLFFSSTKEDVVPIITEPKEKLKTIVKSCFIPQLLSMFIAPAIMVFVPMLLMCFTNFYSAADFFIDNLGTYSYAIVAIFILALFYGAKCSIFYLNNKKRVENGLDLVFFSKREEDIFNVLIYIIGLIVIGLIFSNIFDFSFGLIFGIFLIIVIVGMIFLVRAILSKSTMSRTGNKMAAAGLGIATSGIVMFGVIVIFIACTILGIPLSKNDKRVEYYDKEEKCTSYMMISGDELPLSVADLGKKDKKTKYIDSYCDKNKSIFGKKYECSEQQYDKNIDEIGEEFSYEILNTKWKFIKESYVNKIIEDNDYYKYVEEDKAEAEKWKADKFYKLKEIEADEDFEFVVVYDEQVLYFSTNYEDYIKDNIDLIYDKLVGNKVSN